MRTSTSSFGWSNKDWLMLGLHAHAGSTAQLTSLAVERADAADALANLELLLLLLLLQQRHEGCIAFLSCRPHAQAVHGTLKHASLTGRAASALPRCAAREEPGPGPASACRMWSTQLQAAGVTGKQEDWMGAI